MNDWTAQNRRSDGRPLRGAGRLDPIRGGHRRGAGRSGLRRLAAVRRSGPRPGAAPVAHRRRVPGPARPLRRRRLRPGNARAPGYPLHRLGRAGLGHGHEQGHAPRRCSASTICRPPPATSSQSDSGEELLELHGSFGFPVVVKPRRRRVVARHPDRARRAGARGGGRGGPALRRRRAGRTVHRGARRSPSASWTASRSGAVEIAPKRGFYDFRNKYTSGRTQYHLPARLSPERYRSVLRLATLAHEALGCEGATRVDLDRQRTRQRGRPGDQHLARDDPEQPAAEDRSRRRPVVRGSRRGRY